MVSRVAVCASAPLSEQAQGLADRLGLPCVESAAEALTRGIDLLLSRDDASRLVLSIAGEPSAGAVHAELDEGRMRYRLRQGLRGEMLVRALGRKGHRERHVVDATAGLGRDAIVLAGAGCRVSAIECSPVVHALLEDALERARQSSDPLISDSAGRIQLYHGDSRDWLARAGPVDSVVLDPMFPERRKSARVRKEMAILQRLLREQPAEPLLAVARSRAARRVIVKRPRLAPTLGETPPDRQLTGRSSRFDIYSS